MTHHPIKEQADGTRVYANYHRYTPMADELRTNKRKKPDHPEAVRFHTRWFIPLQLLPEEQRAMPATYPFSKIKKRSG